MPALEAFFGGSFLFMTSAMIGALAFYVRDTRDRGEWVAVAGLAALYWHVADVRGNPLAVLSMLGAFVWAAAFTITCLAPLIARNQIQHRTRMLGWLAGPPAILFVITLMLTRLVTRMSGQTVDAELFAADASLGLGAPAFTVAAWVIAKGDALRFVSQGVYIHLPLAATLVYGALSRRSVEQAHRYVITMVLVVMAGGLCYPLVPGVGTLAIFGSAFPLQPPDAFPIGKIPDPFWPRNCLPSVHLACGLVMCWAVPQRTWAAWATWGYVALMAVSTLVEGGHYLVDLLAAVPFTVAVERSVARDWRRCMVASGAFAAWVLAIRLGEVKTPSASWLLTALSLAVGILPTWTRALAHGPSRR